MIAAALRFVGRSEAACARIRQSSSTAFGIIFTASAMPSGTMIRSSRYPSTGQPQEPTGDPTNSSDPNDQPSPALRPALDDFRRGLTIDDALRVLDALQGEQRGVGQLLEGPRKGSGGEY